MDPGDLANPGVGERDVLIGNSGVDLHILGNEFTPSPRLKGTATVIFDSVVGELRTGFVLSCLNPQTKDLLVVSQKVTPSPELTGFSGEMIIVG